MFIINNDKLPFAQFGSTLPNTFSKIGSSPLTIFSWSTTFYVSNGNSYGALNKVNILGIPWPLDAPTMNLEH
jgi:hypothetical protein